jgi:hypothetical protein
MEGTLEKKNSPVSLVLYALLWGVALFVSAVVFKTLENPLPL